ncbi:MAG: outer membrane lipoprotein-sorting protein [Spirochaetes bacterium]|nr:outer membrane lipoprotein-sorting protein [Spirochaetota bacterium]
MKKISLIISTALLALIFSPDRAFCMSGKEIVEKSEKAIRGNTAYSEISITIKTSRWERTIELKSWDDRIRKRSFSEITAPAKDKGNWFLLVKKDMHQYNPKTARTIKISPSMMLQDWMGSDFTNDDIVKESSMVEDYNHVLEGKEKVEGQDCYRVRMDPKKGAAVVWGKILYFARVGDCLPVKQEYYSERGDLKKVMVCSVFKKMGDRIIPTRYKMQSIKTPDKFTMMEIRHADFNLHIDPSKFSLKSLEKGF